MNKQDMPGVKLITVVEFVGSTWQSIESLSQGKFYYHNPETKASSFKMPAELKDAEMKCETQKAFKVVYSPRPTQWPENLHLIKVITNSYEVTGDLLGTKVYTYEIKFDPEISASNGIERQNIIFGTTHSQKKHNRKVLDEIFGRWEIDNTILYSVKDPRPPHRRVSLDDLHRNFKVIFEPRFADGNFSINHDEIPYTRQEQLLNIFLRDQMTAARYKRIFDGWYRETGDLSAQCEIVRGRGNTGNLAILGGFEGSMKKTGAQTVVFQTDTCSRLLWEDSLHVQLNKLKQTCRSEEEFKLEAEKKFMGKYFILSYSKRSLKISGFDWNQNERSTLGHDNAMTYKDYFKRTYGVKSDLPELCVVKNRDCCYLPQHMRLTAVSGECKDIYDQAMAKINMPIHYRMRKLDEFVAELNKSRDNFKNGEFAKGGGNGGGNGGGGNGGGGGGPGRNPPRDLRLQFNIASRGKAIPAICLKVPKATFKTRRGLSTIDASVVKREWKNTAGFLDDAVKCNKWSVIYDSREDGRFRDGVQGEFMNCFSRYCQRRGFNIRSGTPWGEPRFRAVDLSNHSQYRRYILDDDQIVLILIPDGLQGSEVKVRFTRACQSTKNREFRHQFAKIENISAHTKMFGVFENMAVKMGNILYTVDPCLSPASPIQPAETWVCGMDLSHAKGGGKPSIAVLTMCMKPFEGSLRNVHHTWQMNPPKKDILSYELAWNMMSNSLETAWQRIGKNPALLPKSIWVFRDGVADGQLPEMMSKEVNGIKRALTQFQKKYKLKPKWKPPLQFIVVQKKILWRFGEMTPDGQVRTPRNEAVVLHDYVMSARVWDFIGWFNTSGKNRPLRYIVVKDEMKLSKNPGGAVDLFQFCYSLSYMYAYGIPFPFGNPNQPSPIKYAKHFAENIAQGILSTDSSMMSLQSSSGPMLAMGNPHVRQNPTPTPRE